MLRFSFPYGESLERQTIEIRVSSRFANSGFYFYNSTMSDAAFQDAGTKAGLDLWRIESLQVKRIEKVSLLSCLDKFVTLMLLKNLG